MKEITLRKNRAVVVFFAGIFSNYDQSNFYLNQVKNIISNFNQDGYYSNYPYDSSIYSHSYPFVYQQPNPAVPPYHTYNFFFEVVVVLMINYIFKITAEI
jgi:hypothetical protein